MAITTKGFTTLVSEMVVSIQGAASSLVDLTIGSILRAIVEANAAVVLWLQGLILTLLATTRAATSSGADLDSWVGDFGVVREAAVASSGDVTFSRFTAADQASVPVGATIQTGDGSQTYTVTADTGNPAYSASDDAYILPISTFSVDVPVTADTAGAAGNAQAGQVNTITQPLPGIDTVTNALTFVNGADAESDAALRERFVQFINSLSKATVIAIGYAIESVANEVSYTLTENQNYTGDAQLGYFYVVVDDGTGSPDIDFLDSVNNAIDAVRPVTVTFGVYAPVVVNATVTMTVAVAAGYVAADVRQLVDDAVTAYINSLGIGETLRYTRLAQLAYDASPGVTNASSILLNSGTSDVTATVKQVVKALAVTVS